MLHARADYNRIQDPALTDASLLAPGSSPIAADEPVFLLRARDRAFAATLLAWCQVHRAGGGDAEMLNAVVAHALRGTAWQVANGSKVADAPAGACTQTTQEKGDGDSQM